LFDADAGLQQPCRRKDVLLAVQRLIGRLLRAEQHGGGGYHHRAHHAQDQRNQQGLLDGIVVSHGPASA
jgi:hypothetical protein